MSQWFSPPQKTREATEQLLEYELFSPAAVFKTPEGFVMAEIREQEWPPHDTARRIQNLTGYVMVSCCDPIMGVWVEYPPSRSVADSMLRVIRAALAGGE